MENHLKVEKKKLGFFGGTFDPIHFGHLNLALSLGEKKGLDQIFFSPAYLSPGKQTDQPIASGKTRKEMVELALEGVPNCSCLDWELSSEGPSYTIEVVRYLVASYPEDSIYLILGEDALHGLSEWKEVDELLTLATPLIGGRPGNDTKLKGKKEEIPIMEISSTQIRQRMAEKKYCGHLVPTKVLDYIHTNRLY